jgi:hypothetical protein
MVGNALRTVVQEPSGGNSHVLEPDTLLPSQYFDRVVPEPSMQPEKRLMLAVLEDAVATYQRNASATSRRGRRLFKEAEDWVETSGSSWPFAFENVCVALRLEPEFVRAGLRRWREREAARGPVGNKVIRFPFRRVNGRRHSISGRPVGLRRAG